MNKDEIAITAPLEIGAKVIIRGELCGTVEYVGHVEALDFPEIQVGIKFSEASKYFLLIKYVCFENMSILKNVKWKVELLDTN